MPKPKLKSKFTRAKAAEFYQILAHDRPNPKTELVYKNPYTLLVAVVLSAQATDISVNKATKPLFSIADNPHDMLALGEEGVAKYIKTIGLWRNKTKNVIALSKILIDSYDGDIPHDHENLQKLPGVGRKTANVVLNEAFGQPTIAVDTHIFRVSNRTGLAPGKNPDQVEDILMRVTPKAFMQGAHHWLILHGRYICKARKPECGHCTVKALCLFKDKTNIP